VQLNISLFPKHRNHRQLSQILGTLIFHHRFFVIYSPYVNPLLSLTKNGREWRWTAELQDAFENLCQNIAKTTGFVHTDENRLYCANKEVFKIPVIDIRLQVDDAGATQMVSTASRVPSPAVQWYSM
jgi:hypothetical protein